MYISHQWEQGNQVALIGTTEPHAMTLHKIIVRVEGKAKDKEFCTMI